jgi:hypothetical protein
MPDEFKLSDVRQFWGKAAREALRGTSGFANDWQWIFGNPTVAAIASVVATARGLQKVTTGSDALDGFIAALLAFLITWAVAYVVRIILVAGGLYIKEHERANNAADALRPRLGVCFLKGTVVPRPEGFRHTSLNVINKSEGFVEGVLPRIIESKFKKDGSTAWRNTSIIASLNLSWCGIPDHHHAQKYSARSLRPEPPELVDFVSGPHTKSKRYSREGLTSLPYPDAPFFEVQIDPAHILSRGVVPYFSEKGTYKFVIQVSAPAAGKPEQLTLFVDWDGDDFVIRSADNEILEPVSDETESIEAV